MTATARGIVQFEASGRTYSLHYTVNALCALEQRVGQSVSRIFFDVGNISISTMRVVFCCGLQEHHPEVDIAAAGRLMEELGIHAVTMRVMQAVKGAFPSASGDDPLDQTSATHLGTGMVS